MATKRDSLQTEEKSGWLCRLWKRLYQYLDQGLVLIIIILIFIFIAAMFLPPGIRLHVPLVGH